MVHVNDIDRLKQVIAYMEATEDSQWLVDRVSSKDNAKNCCLGHVFFMGGDDQAKCNEWWNWFESAIATEYMIFPVNDGSNKAYPQTTPKARVLAYLNDVLSGKQKTTYELMDEYMESRATA